MYSILWESFILPLFYKKNRKDLSIYSISCDVLLANVRSLRQPKYTRRPWSQSVRQFLQSLQADDIDKNLLSLESTKRLTRNERQPRNAVIPTIKKRIA
jgi:hypothetical protein